MHSSLFRRQVKNIVKHYTQAQIKVREATSNDPGYPSSLLMSEIAKLTNNKLAFSEIMGMIWMRLNDHGKNWRHVYKALILLDYLIKKGSKSVAKDCRKNIDIIETLKDFQYRNQDGCDRGICVRRKVKELVTLLSDKDMSSPHLNWEEEVQLQLALSMSHEKNEKPGLNSADMDEAMQLQMALSQSMEERQPEQQSCQEDVVLLQKALEESKREMETKGGAALMDLVDVFVESSEPPHSNNTWDMSEGDVWYLASSDPWVSLGQIDVNGRGESKASPSPRTCQISEAFLGPTAASLVNLDSLIPTNPPANKHFLSGLSALSPTNPFLTEQPKLILNKICSSSSSLVPPYSASLPLPMSHQPTSLPSSQNHLTRPSLDMPQALLPPSSFRLHDAPWNNVPNSNSTGRISASPVNTPALGVHPFSAQQKGPQQLPWKLPQTPTNPPANPPAKNNNPFLSSSFSH